VQLFGGCGYMGQGGLSFGILEAVTSVLLTWGMVTLGELFTQVA
jgi:hypothetical protein